MHPLGKGRPARLLGPQPAPAFSPGLAPEENPLAPATPPRTPRAGLWLAASCAAAAAACALLPFANPDLFWHLNAARRIVETGAIPRADWLSYTRAGAPWVDFEWLSQLLWLGAFRGAAGGG